MLVHQTDFEVQCKEDNNHLHVCIQYQDRKFGTMIHVIDATEKRIGEFVVAAVIHLLTEKKIINDLDKIKKEIKNAVEEWKEPSNQK